jgi:hypothetical protein
MSKRITFRELARLINEELTEEQKDCDVTIYDPASIEYFPLFALSDEDTGGVLDPKHPFLIPEI